VYAALSVLVFSRTAIFFVAYFAVIVFGYPGGRPPVRDFDSELLNLPSRFDARWYLQIATTGYAFDPHAAPDVQQNIAFFPAFPLLIRAVAHLFGGGMLNAILAGTLLSLGAFLAALVYLYRFVEERGSSEQANATLWLLALYPFGFFYGAVYTESFFLLATVGAMYHFARREQVGAGAWGVMAGLARPNGFLLAIPIAYLVAQRFVAKSGATSGGRNARTVLSGLAVAATPVAGMLVYSGFIWRLTGDPWMWAREHRAWGRGYPGLLALVDDRIGIISHAGLSGYLGSLPHDALNALGAAFAMLAVWPVARSVGVGYAVWILANMLPPIATGGLISTGRFSSVLFPCFVWLASAVPARHRAGWIGAFAALQALCVAMFYTWRPLY
jgi:hypothetical protein